MRSLWVEFYPHSRHSSLTSVNSDSFPRNIKSLLFRKLNSFFASQVFDVKSENEHMMQPFF